MSTELSFDEAFLVKSGKVVSKDFFYIPVFYYKHSEEGDVDWSWYSLRFNDAEPPNSLTVYASKVSAGESIKNALIKDLANDFHYPLNATFVIDDMKIYDIAKNKKGETLTRMLVIVGLDEKIETNDIHPLGLKLEWRKEGYESYNKVKDYFFGLSDDLYHTQSYVHIPMDGSKPVDPAIGRKDEYAFPDGTRSTGMPPIWF